MSALSKVRIKGERKPIKAVIYGPPKIGKTTLLTGLPNAIVIQTEEGIAELDLPHFPLANSYQDVEDAIAALCMDEHEYQTLCIDSADWLENLIFNRVAEDHKGKSIEDIGYGKGYILAMTYWRQLLDGLSVLRDDRGMSVVFLAHSEIKKFNAPDSEPYDKYNLKLHRFASDLLIEWCDFLGFMNYVVAIKSKDVGFNKKSIRGEGSGQRVLYTAERPAFLAGNRFSMPDQIFLPRLPQPSWPEIARYIPFYSGVSIDHNQTEA